jgi:ankyrin repeat protein
MHFIKFEIFLTYYSINPSRNYLSLNSDLLGPIILIKNSSNFIIKTYRTDIALELKEQIYDTNPMNQFNNIYYIKYFNFLSLVDINELTDFYDKNYFYFISYYIISHQDDNLAEFIAHIPLEKLNIIINRTILLNIGIRTKNINSIIILLDKGLDINIKHNDGWNILQICCERNYEEIIQLLLDRGADFNILDNYGNTILHRSCAFYSLESIKIFINYIDINKQNNYGQSALHVICQSNLYSSKRNELIQLLLDYGINLDIIDKNGNTALLIVCQKKKCDIISLLLKKKQNINIQDKNGNSALYLISDFYDDITSYLISEFNDYILEKYNLIQELLDNNVNLDIQDNNGDTILLKTCKKPKIDTKLISLLLRKKQNLNIQDKNGKTVLQIAYQNNIKIIKFLLDKGADINIKDNDGYTILHRACYDNNFYIVQLLLQYCVNIYISDKEGKTASQISKNNSAITQLLSDYSNPKIKF